MKWKSGGGGGSGGKEDRPLPLPSYERPLEQCLFRSPMTWSPVSGSSAVRARQVPGANRGDDDGARSRGPLVPTGHTFEGNDWSVGRWEAPESVWGSIGWLKTIESFPPHMGPDVLWPHRSIWRDTFHMQATTARTVAFHKKLNPL